MKNLKILAINPGSDSLKIALFENEELLFNETIYYSSNKIKEIRNENDELQFKTEMVIQTLKKHNISLDDIDAFSARAGGLTSLVGGVYLVNDLLLKHAKEGFSLKHASNLGVQIAHNLSLLNKKPAFTVNLVTVDEFQDIARITGLKGIYK